MISTLLVLASLMGAAGVVLAAAAAHAAPGAGLDSAAYLLLFHAVAVLGVAALVQQDFDIPLQSGGVHENERLPRLFKRNLIPARPLALAAGEVEVVVRLELVEFPGQRG